MKRIIMMFLISCIIYINVYPVSANSDEDLSMYDFEGIDKLLDDGGNDTRSFSEMVNELMSGDSEGIFLEAFNIAADKLFYEVSYNKEVILKIVLLAVAAALLSKLSIMFAGSKISDMGFFSVYTLLTTLLITAFVVNVTLAKDIVLMLISFMKCLVPAFFLAVGAGVGVTASLGLYEMALISIMAVEYIVVTFVLPAVSVYVIILILNNVLEEDYLSKFAGVIETIIEWAIKMVPTIALGINLIGSIVLPSVDYAKARGYRKLFGMIPGVGGSLDSFVEIITGSSNLIKNAIGGAALVVVIIIVAIPIIKILVSCLMYKITAAIIQPVSDKRIVSSVEVMAKGANMLYRIILSCGLLFFLTIAIICLGTGR